MPDAATGGSPARERPLTGAARSGPAGEASREQAPGEAPRERPACETTRERLLDAAIDLLAEDGLAGLTHRRVEDRAGASHGSTTYHFGSRDQLLDAAVDRILELEAGLSARAVAEVFGVSGDAMLAAPLPTDIDWTSPAGVALTRRFAHAALHAMLGDRRTVTARYEIYLHAARHPERAARLTAARHRIYAAQEAQAAALGYPDPALYARMITGLMDGLTIHHLAVPDAVIADRGADLIVSAITGLYQSPSPLATPE